ncbi:OmpH family outer membrane protein [Thermodesulfobacteriota bacterium]
MRKKLFAIILFALICFAHSGLVYAADMKIAVIDTQKILRESKSAGKARAIFLKDVQSNRTVLDAKQNELRKLEEEIRIGGRDMAPQVRQEKSENLTREAKELRRLKSDLEEELKKKDAELRRTILQEVLEIVKEYRKKEKYSIVLEKRSIVDSDDAIDITDKIIRLYDIVQ